MREEENGVLMRLGEKPQVDEKVAVDGGTVLSSQSQLSAGICLIPSNPYSALVSSASSRTSSVMRLRRSSYSLASSSVMPRDVALRDSLCWCVSRLISSLNRLTTSRLSGSLAINCQAALRCALN